MTELYSGYTIPIKEYQLFFKFFKVASIKKFKRFVDM